jgi:hypothetical protein
MSKEIADKFRAMADHIEKNVDSPFGGVAMIIPPKDGGEPVEFFQIDPKPSIPEFWGLIRTKCDIAVAEYQNAQRGLQAFRR